MRAFTSITCCVAVFVGFSTIAAAQGKSAPKAKTTGGAATHGTSAHGSGSTKGATYKPASTPKVTGGGKTTGAVKTTAAPKSTTAAHGGGHAKTRETGTATHATTRTEKPPRSTTTSTTNTTSTTTTTTTPPGGTLVLTPVQQKLQRNTNLAAKLQSRLPAGTDLNTAAAGFRNLGQFVAAVNVSNNLGLDFPTLKTAMVTDGKSLGQAIQAQKGTTVDAPQKAHQAEYDANEMIRSTERAEKPSRKSSAGDDRR